MQPDFAVNSPSIECRNGFLPMNMNNQSNECRHGFQPMQNQKSETGQRRRTAREELLRVFLREETRPMSSQSLLTTVQFLLRCDDVMDETMIQSFVAFGVNITVTRQSMMSVWKVARIVVLVELVAHATHEVREEMRQACKENGMVELDRQYLDKMASLDSERALLLFFAQRISCSCLNERYAEVKQIAKTGVCLGCGIEKLDEHLMTCGHCSYPKYCCVECQKNHWPKHKELCTHIAGIENLLVCDPLI
jgi:hypothetical protein